MIGIEIREAIRCGRSASFEQDSGGCGVRRIDRLGVTHTHDTMRISFGIQPPRPYFSKISVWTTLWLLYPVKARHTPDIYPTLPSHAKNGERRDDMTRVQRLSSSMRFCSNQLCFMRFSTADANPNKIANPLIGVGLTRNLARHGEWDT